jgi:hypothetical protein
VIGGGEPSTHRTQKTGVGSGLGTQRGWQIDRGHNELDTNNGRGMSPTSLLCAIVLNGAEHQQLTQRKLP